MYNQKILNANRQIRAVTKLGVITNIILAIAKIVVGILSGSMALIADGIHSVSDMATDFAVLLGVYFGTKEPDTQHPYGHGRIETFSAAFVAVVLAVVGGFMIQRASLAIASLRVDQADTIKVSWAVICVALVSILAKEALYRLTRGVAVKTHSTALYANAWHHRSDAFSSIAVVIGIISMEFGFVYGDKIAAIAVGLMIILVASKIIGGCIHEFAGRAVDSDTVEQIEKIISTEQRIRGWHKLRTQSAGREIFLDLHILVDPQLTITDAHDIAEALERSLHAQIVRPVNITIHIEPDRPDLRK